MKHIFLILQYDGTNYRGWQMQPNTTTVQGLIEEALCKITGRATAVTSAGRTDSGVHALGQAASFFTDSRLTPDIFQRALNALLPYDIRAVAARYVSGDFHCRFSARRKRYFYVISNAPSASPFMYRYVWEVRHPLDIAAMQKASISLVGRYDFKSFCASDTDVDNTVREVFSIEARPMPCISFMGAEIKGQFIKITIEADGFLRHMVRNITGTLVDVGRGKTSPADVENILTAKDRKKAGMTAPGRGLFLDRVFY
ncbi:tRNA pseudouridine(38-40) synthase TruA [Candidatus Magnetominusculus dajiuhuensis]|uniref:tRNA pseudouridine(38-40) synthase TruA n=1 Tax=Candidatus Magnetominusculus dajiuhuensis TaxID=3137712 RepID=UPI003B434A15